MFLETEASFPYCYWSTKMAGIIWLGSTSVQHVNNWQRLSRLPFLSLCKSRKFLETKTYYFISIKKKIICNKKKSKIFGANMVCISICRKLSSILLPFLGNHASPLQVHFRLPGSVLLPVPAFPLDQVLQAPGGHCLL